MVRTDGALGDHRHSVSPTAKPLLHSMPIYSSRTGHDQHLTHMIDPVVQGLDGVLTSSTSSESLYAVFRQGSENLHNCNW